MVPEGKGANLETLTVSATKSTWENKMSSKVF
jgi:hypothetical protein